STLPLHDALPISGLRPAHPQRALAAQQRAARVGQHQHLVTRMVYRHQAQRDQLPQHGAPFGLGEVGADAEGAQRVVAVAVHALVGLAAQDRDDVLRAETESAGLSHAVDARQQLTRRFGGVPRLWRVETVVAIAAGAAGLAEVSEQPHTPAVDGFGQAEHGVELGARDALVGVVGLRLLDQATLLDHVGEAVGHPGLGRFAVTARAAGLLVVALDALGHVEVRDEADVGFVD